MADKHPKNDILEKGVNDFEENDVHVEQENPTERRDPVVPERKPEDWLAPGSLNIASRFMLVHDEVFNVIEDLELGSRDSWRDYAPKPN